MGTTSEQEERTRKGRRPCMGGALLDGQVRVVCPDPGLAALLGLEGRGEDLIGVSLAELFDHASSALTPSGIASAIREGRDILGYSQGGDRVRMTVYAMTPQDHPGYPFTMLGYLEELAPGQLPDLLHVGFVNLDELEECAEINLRETVGSILAGLAHEIRNPLAAIVSLTEGVLSLDLDEDVAGALERIPGLVDRIERMLQSARAYLRPDPPQMAWHRLGFIVSRALALLSHGPELERSFQLGLTEAALPVFVDFEHAVSILTNLLDNAVQLVGPERVALDVRRIEREANGEEAVVAIDIVDEGPGVPGDIQARIFEPFFTRRAGGTGIGLALARDLARINGGDVFLKKTSPQGSTFRVLFPSRPACAGLGRGGVSRFQTSSRRCARMSSYWSWPRERRSSMRWRRSPRRSSPRLGAKSTPRAAPTTIPALKTLSAGTMTSVLARLGSRPRRSSRASTLLS